MNAVEWSADGWGGGKAKSWICRNKWLIIIIQLHNRKQQSPSNEFCHPISADPTNPREGSAKGSGRGLKSWANSSNVEANFMGHLLSAKWMSKANGKRMMKNEKWSKQMITERAEGRREGTRKRGKTSFGTALCLCECWLESLDPPCI